MPPPIADMPVSVVTFATIPKEQFENDDVLLRADYSIDWESSKHTVHIALAIISTVLFVIGMPLVQLLCLRKGKLAKARGEQTGVFVTIFDLLSEASSPHAQKMMHLRVV